MATKTLPIRMLYAPSKELIDYAREFRCNWVVAASSGHKGPHPGESSPVVLDGYPKLEATGRVSPAQRASERRRLQALFAYAKQAGMKVIYHSYEPSMPFGFDEAYPELWSKEIREYHRTGGPAVRRNRNLCVARPEVRAALAAKVEAVCRAFPELDGFMYTNNESSSSTKVWHRCDTCRDIPFPRMMELLHDTMLEGIRRSGRPVQLFYRCWGSNDHDHHYHDHCVDLLRYGFGKREGDSWLAAYVKAFQPAHLHFKPSRDNPVFARKLAGRGTVVVYKASWADTNLHHPLNPAIGLYAGNPQVCELSFEHCRAAPTVFWVMGREMQRRARLCARKGVDGLCAVPVCWGAHDANATSAHPSRWSLAEANMGLFAALLDDPDCDLLRAAGRYLARRYGQALPKRLAEILLESEDVAADAMNVLGVRATGDTFKGFRYSLLRYGPLFPGWRAKLRATPATVARVRRDKAKTVARAEGLLAEIAAFEGRIPARAFEEFMLCFRMLRDQAVRCQHTHSAYMLMSSVAEGHARPTAALLEEIEQHLRRGAGPEPS